MDITVEQLTYRYSVGTPFEYLALKDVNFSISSGTFLALVGHTGSGKSTLIQHLNGLLKPTKGKITLGHYTIKAGVKNKGLKPLRQKVGMVFQYPEHQLFEETVEKDICFGPMNFGVSERVAKKRAKDMLAMVGVSERYLQSSPFELSGGQMRRVAIAGVLAMNPEVLILDEPTAGLDPRGQREILDMFARLHRQQQLTTILVTHHMEDVAQYADDVLVMKDGTIYKHASPLTLFSQPELLQDIGLGIPATTDFILQLEERFSLSLPKDYLTTSSIVSLVKDVMQREGDKP